MACVRRMQNFEIYNGSPFADRVFGASHGETINMGTGNDEIAAIEPHAVHGTGTV